MQYHIIYEYIIFISYASEYIYWYIFMRIRVHGARSWYRRVRAIDNIRLHLIYIYPNSDLIVVEVYESAE